MVRRGPGPCPHVFQTERRLLGDRFVVHNSIIASLQNAVI